MTNFKQIFEHILKELNILKSKFIIYVNVIIFINIK